MKKITLLVAMMIASASLFAQSKWSVDKNHSKIGFSVRHMMLSDVEGYFKKFDASITASKEDFSDAVFEITIDVASINTENDKRDNDLRSASYFDVGKYPQISFKSTSLSKVEDKKYKVTGNLTMHGVTKPVTLDLTLNGVSTSQMTKKPVAGFKVTGKINRTDFGVGSVSSAMVGNDIELKANGEFGKE